MSSTKRREDEEKLADQLLRLDEARAKPEPPVKQPSEVIGIPTEPQDFTMARYREGGFRVEMRSTL